MNRKQYLVLDTNILVSAVLSKTSKARQALDKAQDIGKILMSSSVLLEIEEVLFRPKFDKYVTTIERRFFLSNFLKTVEFVEVGEIINICRDPKDDKILALALNGKADYIITGDQDLLVLKLFESVQIITIDEFLNLFL
ncbi:MAG: putative toxin-antitoxin system toxin component, PIN family [Dolichospermum sp. DET50]|nr:putative toxin-antitoxin system toxin component, PIN family [Dolichospermum sp. DET66]MBS3030919.1 putative toxin-antitoxin system toxin component, PIN family [Dolichospermum sp. DET67]MBS3036129.1 putative toxin-antitoxin system toxin component, PIN family [Dolichospermum sp. DET50]QSX68205.1 MAG: putative toxin-antitoxin system toxin component, PIN family [Dolichospermum sp. DET69]